MTFKPKNLYLAVLVGLAMAACSNSESDESVTELQDVNYSDQIKITEVLTKDESGGSDWIEIQVIGQQQVNLKGFTLADSNNAPTSLPDITLESGQFLVILATDEAPEDGSYYVSFKLGDNDSVTLAYNGQVLDSMSWVDADVKSGRSYGDYKGELQRLYPTPNASNIPFNAFITDEVVKVEIDLSQDDWQSIINDPTAEEYKPATIEYNGIKVENIAFRTKGNSSLSAVARDPDSIRYSFKADINYYDDQQKLLGLKKLNFNSIYSDPSMMREVLSYQMLDELAVPSPRITYVDLYVAGQHMGLYNVVEAIDSEFIERHFEFEDGDLYKAEKPSTLEYVDMVADTYSGMVLKTNEETSLSDALVSFIDSLNHDPDPALRLNVDTYLRYLAVNTFLMNLDSYQGPFAHNFYLYQNQGENGDLMTLLPWDYNMSMSAFPDGCSYEKAAHLMIDEPVVSNIKNRPLVSLILQNEEYKQQYHFYLEQLVNEIATYDKMAGKIETLQALIAPYVEADPTKFYDYDTWKLALHSSIEVDLMGGPGMPPGGIDPGTPPGGTDPGMPPGGTT
jgi:spore coat protein CotH